MSSRDRGPKTTKTKANIGIDSISTDSITHSASSCSDAALSPASRSRRLCLEERREKLLMLARHGSGDSSGNNHHDDGGDKKGKSRQVIHVARGSKLFPRNADSGKEGRRSWSLENRANRHEPRGRRSSSFQAEERRRRKRSPARASAARGATSHDLVGSRARCGKQREASRRHDELRRAESSGRLERIRKPSSIERRGADRVSQVGRSDRDKRRESFHHIENNLRRSASGPAMTTAAAKTRPRAAVERNRNHESLEHSYRFRHGDIVKEKRPVSTTRRDTDRPVDRNDTYLDNDHANRQGSGRINRGHPRPSSRGAEKRRILHQSRKCNADRDKRVQVRQENKYERPRTTNASNDERAIGALPQSKEATKVPISKNHKSDTDRTKEALRQAKITLLSSQLIGLNLKSDAEEKDKVSPSSLNETTLVPVPPPAPVRPIDRLKTSNRRGRENDYEIMPLLTEEINKSRSNDIIDQYKKKLHGEANDQIVLSAEDVRKNQADDNIFTHGKRLDSHAKETRVAPLEDKVHRGSVGDKVHANVDLKDDFHDDDDNVSIEVCVDTEQLVSTAQLDRRVSSLTMRESDWKLDLTSSLVKFDESDNSGAPHVALVERGRSLPATGEVVATQTLAMGQYSNTTGEGITTSIIESNDKDSVHSRDMTYELQRRSTYDESINVIDIGDLDDSIIDPSHDISKRLQRRLPSSNDSNVTGGTSLLEAVPKVNNMSFRALADHLTGRKTKASDLSHIDVESTSSFFADVSAFDTKEQEDPLIRSKKVDKIVQKISKCREKSWQQQAGRVGDDKKTDSLTATANKQLSQKFPPPPPRRSHQTTSAAKNHLPNMGPSPPSRNSEIVRSTHDRSSGIPLSPPNTKTKPPCPRPPPPSQLTHRVTASQQTSSHAPHNDAQAPPAPPLHGKNASAGSPKVDTASHSALRTDPVNNLLSQLQNVDRISPANDKVFRRSISGGSIKNDHIPSTSSILRRRNSTGVMSTIKHDTNNSDSGEVSGMPYKDSTGGGYGAYTGQVDQWGRPHGTGKILYHSGASFDGKWVNGVPCLALTPYQHGAVSNFNGTTGDLNHYYLMAPSGYGGVPPSNYNNTNQLNMSLNSFNHSMNWDYW
ncbi:hypothetical protein ACHAW6_004927 [Cyclotella cf. meneghiniana]